jgi:23S rRNA (pseudouridine1915-N3)-methyltransferase
VHLRIVAVGRIRDAAVARLCDERLKRLRPYHRIDVVEVRDDDALAKAIDPAAHVWLLERTGDQLSSEELAQRLEGLATAGTSSVTFVIGGAFGVDPALRARANFLWSLSRATFLHEWARALVLEQLYRAAKIARNEPYHH